MLLNFSAEEVKRLKLLLACSDNEPNDDIEISIKHKLAEAELDWSNDLESPQGIAEGEAA